MSFLRYGYLDETFFAVVQHQIKVICTIKSEKRAFRGKLEFKHNLYIKVLEWIRCDSSVIIVLLLYFINKKFISVI